MHRPLPTPFRLRALAAGAALCAGTPAWGQQPAPAPVPYNPPPFVIIAPGSGPNPYLMYVPQAAPPQPFQMPSFSLPAPAPAPADKAADAPKPGPTLSALGKSLRNYFTEEELDLLFDYMRESVLASFKGEEVSLPPDLAFKLEVLLVRMKKEGILYLDNLMRQLEQDIKRSLKEKLLTPPPPGAQPPEAAPLPQTTPALAPTIQPPPPPPPGNSKLPARQAKKNV